MKYKPGNILIRARNGDVVAYDETGLILRLSDEVLDDIRARLDTGAPHPVLRDIDAWNHRRAGEWMRFDACLPPFTHTRAYRRRVEGGSVLADAQGPLVALLTIGGTAASLSFDGAPHHPHHVVAPSDDLGAVGACGLHPVRRVDRLQTLPEATLATLFADAILADAQLAGQPLPLIATRSETDGSTTAAALKDGQGVANFITTLDNLVDASKTLATRLKVKAVTIDFGPEDVTSSVADFAHGIRATVDVILDACAARDLARPVVILRCDGGPDGPERQWELAAHSAGQPTLVTGPRYAETRNAHDRLTRSGAVAQARLDAAALVALDQGHAWQCPLPILAERSESKIAVAFLSDTPLFLAPEGPSGAPEHFGFRLSGASAPSISGVTINPDDPCQILVETAGPVPDGVFLEYAMSGLGLVCDSWTMVDDGQDLPLARWALPAKLPVH